MFDLLLLLMLLLMLAFVIALTSNGYVCRIGHGQQRPESYPAREEVSRSHSVKSSAKSHRVFRASDLIVCEVLGRGFYGQAIKVSDAVQVCNAVKVSDR